MKAEILDFERSFVALLGGGDVDGDARVSLFAGAELFELFGEDFFALVTHADEGSIRTFSGTGTGDKFRETFDFSLLFGDTRIFGSKIGGVLAAEFGVIAIVNFHFVGGFVDEEDFVGDLIEEIDVMRNHKDSSLIVTKVVGDELLGFDVKVVGGFVKQQETSVFKKYPRESNFGFLTARKLGHFMIYEAGEMHFVEDFEKLVVKVGNIVGIDEVLKIGNTIKNSLAVRVFGEFFVFLIELVLKIIDRATSGDVFPDCDAVMLGWNGDFLRQIAETKARQSDFAIIKLLLTKNNTEESGLPCAVNTNDTNFVAGF